MVKVVKNKPAMNSNANGIVNILKAPRSAMFTEKMMKTTNAEHIRIMATSSITVIKINITGNAKSIITGAKINATSIITAAKRNATSIIKVTKTNITGAQINKLIRAMIPNIRAMTTAIKPTTTV